MSLCLALSLCHNSSAVIIDGGVILCGYEEERLSKIKSDSAFPMLSILEIGKHYDLEQVNAVYVSHWEIFGNVNSMSDKHWKPDFIAAICPNADVYADIDHHECHVEALRVFTQEPFEWEIVADGFGNFNEVISIYHNQKLAHRAFGFEKSLGLLYQYATAYLGLKMNQDEYKLLGYEAFILDFINEEQLAEVHKCAHKYADTYIKAIITEDLSHRFDAVAGIDALPNIRMKISSDLDRVLIKCLKIPLNTIEEMVKKTVIAFFVQNVVEVTMTAIIRFFCMSEVALTGGLFMNVKLNRTIMNNVKKISVMPICGDQSGGLGAYQHYNNDLKWPGHLYWGRRDLKLNGFEELERFFIFHDKSKAQDKIFSLLRDGKIVNFITGAMEFGARALGNTSTLAVPTETSVRYINHVNERSTIMPMAGMVSTSVFCEQYADYDKVIDSQKYMIMTFKYKGVMNNSIIGCHHVDPLIDIYTNRIQLLESDHPLHDIVKEFGMLINTSFNIHGMPIIFNDSDIMNNHNFQIARDSAKLIHTVVLI